MKKIISLVLTLCMILSCSVVCAYADGDPVAEIYTANDDVISCASVEEALSTAEAGDIVYLLSDATLWENATVKSGCTLVIPYSDTDSGSTEGEANVKNSAPVNGSAFATLTVDSSATLTISGTVIVSGNQQSTQPKAGCLTGDYGKINLLGNIVVADGGELYARGEVSGTGTVTAESGSSIYQLFQIQDWRGGTAARAAMNANIFPFNRFEYKNITSTVEYKNGSNLFGQYYFVVSGTIFGYTYSVESKGNIPLIGTNGMLSFTGTSTTDKITTTYNNDVVNAVIDGEVQTGDIAFSINLFGLSFPISSSSVILPFGYNFGIEVADGASLTVTNDIKLMPGCDMTVNDGGMLVISETGSLYFYAADDYSNTFSYNYTWYPSADATLTVENGATVNYNGNYGTIATSDNTGSNLDITWPSTPSTTTVYEYENNTTATPVTFYIA